MESTSASELRQKIAAFITGYEHADLPEEEKERKAEKFASGVELEEWLMEALATVNASQNGKNPVRLATHVVKNMHPDIRRADSLFRPALELKRSDLIGTSSLGSETYGLADVVGNSANKLKRFKLAAIFIDDESVLDLARRGDSRLVDALVDDQDIRAQIIGSICLLGEPLNRTHTKSKQLYWLIGEDPLADDDFHLLAPLYATSLAHRVFQAINADRFSDQAKAARDARRKKQPSEHGYCEYPSLAIQRFGGSKPQNISQLNIERGGKSYLLGSAPPTWRSRSVSPIRSTTAFYAYGRRPGVLSALQALGRFLASDPRRNMHTRNNRDQLTAELVDELIVFTSEMHQLAPGWTDDWHCRLAFEQQCWLDPHRAATDQEFAQQMVDTDWLPVVCRDFSRWLNGRLERYWKLATGDPEHRHFARMAASDPNIKRAIDDAYQEWQAKLQTELAALDEVFNDDDE